VFKYEWVVMAWPLWNIVIGLIVGTAMSLLR